MGNCPVSGPCFCTGACQDSSTWDKSDIYPGTPDPSDFGTGWNTSTLDLTVTYFWAFPQDELEGNSEALQFIINNGANLVEFSDGYVIVSADFLPNLMKWGENGFTIIAIDDSKNGVRTQIRGLS